MAGTIFGTHIGLARFADPPQETTMDAYNLMASQMLQRFAKSHRGSQAWDTLSELTSGECCDVLGKQGQNREGRWHHSLWPFRCATHQLCLSSHLFLASRIAADARPMKHSLLRFFPDQVLFFCFCHPVLSLLSLSFITLESLGHASNNNPMACWSFSLFNLNLAQ
jgi:hypothetical protein